jgi:hypothetical protein
MNPNRSYVPPSHRAAAIVIAALASVTTLGGVFALFDCASATPWLPLEQAALVSHCDVHRTTSQRQACLREAVATGQAAKLAAR